MKRTAGIGMATAWRARQRVLRGQTFEEAIDSKANGYVTKPTASSGMATAGQVRKRV